LLTSQPGPPSRRRALTDLRRDAAPHARPVLHLAIATAVGTVSAFAVQVISARAVGPDDFGLLAAFLAIINVASVASSALQNAVAVRTAETTVDPDRRPASGRRGPAEATILGLGGAVGVAALTPVLVPVLDATVAVVLLAAATIPLCFWLSNGVGVLQGLGRAEAAMWWTTLSVVIRVALTIAVLAAGLGIGGLLGAVLVGTGAAAIGAHIPARRVAQAGRSVFTKGGATVLLLSLLSAWLVNADVVALQATADGTVAGTFASAAVLVKSAFLLPATISIYLLPRFVRNLDNGRLVRLGERITVAVTVVFGALAVAAFWLIGGLAVRIIYGQPFAASADVLVALSLAYLPWITAQSVLIRLIAQASRTAVAVLIVAVVLQTVGFAFAAADVTAVIWVQAGVGVGVLGAFAVLVRRLNRSASADRSAHDQEATQPSTVEHVDKEAAL
jgi:O-antigen/teichoic acid export membrane protein